MCENEKTLLLQIKRHLFSFFGDCYVCIVTRFALISKRSGTPPLYLRYKHWLYNEAHYEVSVSCCTQVQGKRCCYVHPTCLHYSSTEEWQRLCRYQIAVLSSDTLAILRDKS
jgi:hypothetical protein